MEAVMTVDEYCSSNRLTKGQLFFRAWKAIVNHECPREEQKKVCNDLGLYQVKGEVPNYVSCFLAQEAAKGA